MVSARNGRDGVLSPHCPTLADCDGEGGGRCRFIDLELCIPLPSSAFKPSPRDVEQPYCLTSQDSCLDGASASPAGFGAPLIDLESVKVEVSKRAAAAVEASRNHSRLPSVSEATHVRPQVEERRAWAWASVELKQKMRAIFSVEAQAGEPSPAQKFGAGFRAIRLGDKPGPNPHREIEKLKTRLDELETRRKPKADRGTNPATASGTGRRRSPKMANLKLASRRLKQLQKGVIDNLKATTKDAGEEEVRRELYEKVFRYSFKQLVVILHDRYDYPMGGAKTISRTPEYKSWALHRRGGNAKRLDVDSPAVAGTAKGGESSRSGRSRDKQFADAHGLRPARFGKVRAFDEQAVRNIAADPVSRSWCEKNSSVLDRLTDSEEGVDNP